MRTMLTDMARPWSSKEFKTCMAASASSGRTMVTKAKPRDSRV